MYCLSPAQQKKLHFSNNLYLSKFAFDLNHCDVWGPFSTPTIEGHKYFLIIIDDCTWATWVFFLKSKSKVKTLISQFFIFVQTQFSTKTKKFVKTNSTKFSLSKFFASKSVLLQLSCVETPQKILLWNVKVHHPSYNHFQTFGCLCFASSLQQSRSKFDSRVRQYIFLGYPFDIKGYKLLDPITHQTFISWHVIFHAHIFPYKHISGAPTNFPPTSTWLPHLPIPFPCPSSMFKTSLTSQTASIPSTSPQTELYLHLNPKQLLIHLPFPYLRGIHLEFEEHLVIYSIITVTRYTLCINFQYSLRFWFHRYFLWHQQISFLSSPFSYT